MKQTIKYFIYCSPKSSYSIQESNLISFAEKEELNVIGICHGSFRSMLLQIKHGKARGIIIASTADLPTSPLFTWLLSKNLIRDIKSITQTE